MVEPVAANMGVVPPEPGFLEGLRALCDEHGALLFFDEVITGFRVAYEGAGSVYGVTPDLTALGKIMGGGFPCAAFGGRRDVMEQLAPTGPVYQAGTLSGNPVAVAAGIAALDLADRERSVRRARAARRSTSRTVSPSGSAPRASPPTVNRAGSMFSVFFTDRPVRNFEDAKAADHERYARFFHHMLDRGVYLPPSGYELWSLSTAHDDADDRANARGRGVVRGLTRLRRRQGVRCRRERRRRRGASRRSTYPTPSRARR